jgi:glycosyltransferase involved in cell wall biosynthesis
MDWTWLCLPLAALPAAIGTMNLLRMARLGPAKLEPESLVSILIPARDEAGNIAACVGAALASSGVAVEVLVMDDGSTDGTGAIVAGLAAADPRVRPLTAPPLPPGWTGKVHACAKLAEAARGSHLLFIDADVRLAPEAAARMAAHAATRDLGMVSGVPRQLIGSLGEALTVPAINLLLVGYLPGGGRAETERPDLAAACGQLLLCERGAYEAVGGHAAIPHALHDALALARLFRRRGHRTEVVDGAPLATCRMYSGFSDSWAGFVKNAREGMATSLGLPIWTVLLAGAHLWPWALLPEPQAILAIGLMLGLRAAITWRAGEPWWTVPLHPAIVTVALAIQWWAMACWVLGIKPGWKGRAYSATGAA